MAQGDVVTLISSGVANNGVVDIKPASGSEWTINNITYAGAMELYKTDGASTIKVDSDTSFGGRFRMNYRCTNAVWYQVKNVSGASMNISYDGVQNK